MNKNFVNKNRRRNKRTIDEMFEQIEVGMLAYYIYIYVHTC